jgi:hypothetical protein
MIAPISIVPPIALAKAACQSGIWLIEWHENYQKQSIRNRYHVLSPNGIQTLTIGVIGQKGEKITTPEIQIGQNKNWLRDHIRSIKTAYGSAPFFDFYMDDIEELLSYPASTLGEFHKKSIDSWLELLQISPEIKYTDSFRSQHEKYDFRARIKTNRETLGVTLRPYVQVFSDRFDFIPNLSVIDLLFNLGPEAGAYLKGVFD